MANFLSAHWKNLLMLNYAIEPSILEPFLPTGTELDYYNGKCYVSLVSFMFLDTKIKGIGFPLHRDFEEMNLRFYVRFKENGVYKRGVVFIKEIVPKKMICFVANTLYGEHYCYHKMKNSLFENDITFNIKYEWLVQKEWNFLQASVIKNAVETFPNSEEEFITEHYWGYAKVNEKQTTEYHVIHPKWAVYPVLDYHLNINVPTLYGHQFVECLSAKPTSVFVAVGSDVRVTDRKVWRY